MLTLGHQPIIRNHVKSKIIEVTYAILGLEVEYDTLQEFNHDEFTPTAVKKLHLVLHLQHHENIFEETPP